MSGIKIILIAILFASYSAKAQLPAFPGAEGAGKFTTGGRGTATIPTTVYEVTSLGDDNTAGTLRYALSQNVPYRTIVFRISGTIHLNSKLTIRANTTIAGQTAPGDGICIADHPVVISGDNVILRYIRIRMGDKNQNLGMVDGSGGDDVLGNLGNKNIIIDHCTISWSSDEALTIYRGDSVTIQWNIVSEPLNYSYHFEAGGTDYQEHGYGGIWGSRNGSFHHNLIAHAKGRCPRFAGSSTYTPGTVGQEKADFRNNVVYNWISYSTNGGEGGYYNMVNNYYKYGPSTSTGTSSGVPVRFMIMNPSKSSTLPYPKIFMAGNYVDGSTTITQNNWRGAAMSGGSLADTGLSKVETAYSIVDLPTQEAPVAYDFVLNHAGVKLPGRDTLDQRIVNDVRNRTGKVIDVQGGYPHGTAYAQTVSAWPQLSSLPAPADTDHDGMPDSWENAMGLNPSNASDRNSISFSGYTQLENYLNSLAADGMLVQGSLQNFSQVIGTPSPLQSYTFSGKNLTGNISVVPPAGYEVSIDGSTWFNYQNGMVITAVNGIINSTLIRVRLNAAAAGNASGIITHTSPVGSTIQVQVNGTTSSATAIQDINRGSQYAVYPNPAMSQIQIRHPRLTSDETYTIYSIDGKQADTISAKNGTDRTTTSIAHLAAGHYVIVCRKGRARSVVNFIKTTL